MTVKVFSTYEYVPIEPLTIKLYVFTFRAEVVKTVKTFVVNVKT